jgi:hypothetical protein
MESTVAAPWKSRLHALHAGEERLGKAAVAEQVVVEEVEMAAGEAVDLGQGVVDTLGVEAFATLKECVLVTEVAVLRAAARDDDGIRHEIVTSPDEVAANGRNALQGAA